MAKNLKRNDRRMAVVVAGTVLWVGVGNTYVHAEAVYVWGLAVPFAVLLWLATGFGRDDGVGR